MSVHLHRLSNGLRLVTEVMPGLESAAVGVWVSAGARHEAEAENGIAHFLEHMAFKGTSRRSALQIAEEIEDVGGYINAWTSRESTAYYARVLRGDVPLALDVIADIVLDPAFHPEDIETERGVILQEIGQTLDTPDDIIFDWLQEVAYPGQPLGRPILGPAERVAGFTRADLQGFVSRHYHPERMVVAAAGAIDPEALLRQVEALFGTLPPGPGEGDLTAHYAGGERRVRRKLEQAHMVLAFETPGFTDPRIHAAQVFSTALGGGMSSRLFQELREKRGLCYAIYASTGAHAETGLMSVYAGTSGHDLAALAGLTVDEVTRAAEDMGEAEVARAKAQLKAGLLMGLEGPSARAERLARMVAVWDRVLPLPETVARIDAVTPASAREFAQGMLAGAPSLALYGPVGRAPALARLRARLDARPEVHPAARSGARPDPQSGR